MAVVFVAGGTGYVGSRLISALLRRDHRVRALARPGSESRLPAGAEVVTGDALRGDSYASDIAPSDTFVHLVGTPRPSPAKAAEFERVDLVSVREAARVTPGAGIRHFIYVSVAQPAPIMRAYVAARAQGETLVRATDLPATVLRPWYVLGPGHRWPCALIPLYAVLKRLPSAADTARRLDLITIRTMVNALVSAVESPPPHGVRVWDVTGVRHAAHILAPRQ
jgi:uncharacterized protein YbjT (DUF2867 family)